MTLASLIMGLVLLSMWIFSGWYLRKTSKEDYIDSGCLWIISVFTFSVGTIILFGLLLVELDKIKIF